MPYRRLPNTDPARLRALRKAVDKSYESDPRGEVISLAVISKARNLLARFSAAYTYYQQCCRKQSRENRKHTENVRMARLYVSHFIQVLNMSVIRGEIKAVHKECYGLSAENHALPELASDEQLSEWGGKIIEGEKLRLAKGGTPIYNPNIARVKVFYDIFSDSFSSQKMQQMITDRSREKLKSMRDETDSLILNIWNQIESRFLDVTPAEKRLEVCSDYGVIYYYRPGEKNE